MSEAGACIDQLETCPHLAKSGVCNHPYRFFLRIQNSESTKRIPAGLPCKCTAPHRAASACPKRRRSSLHSCRTRTTTPAGREPSGHRAFRRRLRYRRFDFTIKRKYQGSCLKTPPDSYVPRTKRTSRSLPLLPLRRAAFEPYRSRI